MYLTNKLVINIFITLFNNIINASLVFYYAFLKGGIKIKIAYYYNDDYYCERKDRICVRCEIQKEPWVKNLPSRDNGNCLGCNKVDLFTSRNGIYIEPYCRQICRDCWNWAMPDEWFLELKEQFSTRNHCELDFK